MVKLSLLTSASSFSPVKAISLVVAIGYYYMHQPNVEQALCNWGIIPYWFDTFIVGSWQIQSLFVHLLGCVTSIIYHIPGVTRAKSINKPLCILILSNCDWKAVINSNSTCVWKEKNTNSSNVGNIYRFRVLECLILIYKTQITILWNPMWCSSPPPLNQATENCIKGGKLQTKQAFVFKINTLSLATPSNLFATKKGEAGRGEGQIQKTIAFFQNRKNDILGGAENFRICLFFIEA